MKPKNPKFLAVAEQLKLFPIFNKVDDAVLDAISDKIELRNIRKNRYIYKFGEISQELFFLNQGTIKIGTLSKDGKEVIKSIIHPEALFGEMALFGEKDRENFAQAIEIDTQIYAIEAKAFKIMMMQNPKLCNNVINLLGKKLHFAEKRIESLVFKDARERIIDFLKDSATNFGKQIGYEMLFKHSLTQQDIANFTGTSRQTVTSVLNDLKKTNQIYFKRKSILIRDMTSLS